MRHPELLPGKLECMATPSVIAPDPDAPTMDVFMSACLQVAADPRLEEFRWLKSKRQLVRKVDDVQHIIYFQTSYLNARGAQVLLDVGVNVRSSSLRDWRTQRGVARPNDWIAGLLLGYLSPDRHTKRWNVGGSGFVLVVEEIRGLLADYAVPFFEAFSGDPTAMLELPEEVYSTAFTTNWAAPFERLVQLGRPDLIPWAYRRLPRAVEDRARSRYEERRANPNLVSNSRDPGDSIFELGLAEYLGWSGTARRSLLGRRRS